MFQPGILSVLLNLRGKRVFRLEDLAPRNGFRHDAAHDAIGDTEAMLHLCRLVHEHARDHWSNFVRFGPKVAVLDFMEGNEVFSFTDTFLGRTYSWAAMADAVREPALHVELQMYDGFTSPEDQARMAEFHATPWSERGNVLDRLDDARLKILGGRLLYTEAPEEMLAQDHSRHDADLAKRLMADDSAAPWRTLAQAIRETDDLLTGWAATEATLLEGLRDYLVRRTGEADAMIAGE